MSVNIAYDPEAKTSLRVAIMKEVDNLNRDVKEAQAEFQQAREQVGDANLSLDEIQNIITVAERQLWTQERKREAYISCWAWVL